MSGLPCRAHLRMVSGSRELKRPLKLRISHGDIKYRARHCVHTPLIPAATGVPLFTCSHKLDAAFLTAYSTSREVLPEPPAQGNNKTLGRQKSIGALVFTTKEELPGKTGTIVNHDTIATCDISCKIFLMLAYDFQFRKQEF